MAVTIELDLDAGGATGEIGAVASSLKGLEQVANDIDIDFDADLGDIIDELNDFSDALDDLDTGNLQFIGELDDVADKLDDALDSEIDLNVNQGDTNKGDSTGADPPSDLITNLTEIADNSTDLTREAAGVADGGAVANIFEREYGPDNILMDEGTLIDQNKWKAGKTGFIGPTQEDSPYDYANRKLPNLGANDPNFEVPSSLERVAERGRFGMEPVSMDLRRMRIDESIEEILEANRLDSEPSNWPSRLDDIVEDNRDITISADELLDGAVEARDAAAEKAPSHPGFGHTDFGFNYESRMSELTQEEREEIMENPFQSGEWGSGDPTLNEWIGDNKFRNKADSIKSASDAMDELGDAQSSLGKKLRSFKPTMGKYMQLLAAIIPVAVGLGVQLLGVAAALGAVGAAGAGLMGLGLLGHAESFSGAMANAETRVKNLKRELFETFQPAMKQFAPIQARMFDAIPDMMGPVAEEMEGLTKFEDTLFTIGQSLANGMAEAVSIINDNERAISDLATTFTRLGIGAVLDLFEWLIQTAAENKTLIIDLADSLVSLATVGYRVAMIIARMVAAMKPLFGILEWISGILNSKLAVGFLTAIAVGSVLALTFTKIATAVWGLGVAVSSLIGFLSFLGSGSIIGGIIMGFKLMISYIGVMIAELTTLELVAWSAAAALAATGVGAIVVGAGMAAGGAMKAMGPDSPTGGSYGGGVGGGGGTVYHDNRTFNINQQSDDYASRKAIERSVNRSKEEDDATSLPPVNTSSSTSDGRK